MNYQEQLKDIRWKEKRNKILGRDNYTCQKCENKSFQNNNILTGLIISNDLNFRTKNHFGIEKWRFLVWNFRDNELFRGNTDNLIFTTEKSYICFYSKEPVKGFYKNQIIGLKEIGNSEIHLKNVDFFKTLTSNNHKEFIEKQTLDLIYTTAFEPPTLTITFGLHVHHTYYQEGRYAWDYPDRALETLCPTCHNEIHQTNEIPILDYNENELDRVYYPTAIPFTKSNIRRRRSR